MSSLASVEQTFYTLADLSAAAVAAVSGAQAARQKGLDLFGIYTVAYVTACIGGIFRDMAIGALPPVGLADWRYLACAIAAASVVLWKGTVLDRLRNSVLVFDALGLGVGLGSGCPDRQAGTRSTGDFAWRRTPVTWIRPATRTLPAAVPFTVR